MKIGRRVAPAAFSFLFRSPAAAILGRMTDPAERLTPASPDDLAGAVGTRGSNRGGDDGGMAAHTEVVVRAPDGDFAGPVLFASRAPHRYGKASRVAFKIDKDAKPPFCLQALDHIRKAPVIIHG